MNRAHWIIAASAAAAALTSSGCSPGVDRPGISKAELLAKLQALPGVSVQDNHDQPTMHGEYLYYVLHFTQPIDHQNPSRGSFQLEVSLMHRDDSSSAPMIVHTSGYDDYYHDQPVELTELLGGNQVSIEHRYFGTSRPAHIDWNTLTIAQMAADEHDVITALRSIYDGAFLTTGGSKGGATAVFHRAFYPKDVEGTVAYVAPISFGTPDTRYAGYVETLGPPACHDAVRQIATRMLADHRQDILDRALVQAQSGYVYSRIALPAAVEASIVSLEWTFWQDYGVGLCDELPRFDASPDELFAFLSWISPITDDDDEQLARFEPYFYQSYAQLGFPSYGVDYLAQYRNFTDSDFDRELPTPFEPLFDSSVMRDIDDFVEHRGSQLLFIYGEWDPWTGGRFALGDAADSAELIAPHARHTATIASLAMADRDVALGKLEAWTGVKPMLYKVLGPGVTAFALESEQMRMPPALVRALYARK